MGFTMGSQWGIRLGVRLGFRLYCGLGHGQPTARASGQQVAGDSSGSNDNSGSNGNSGNNGGDGANVGVLKLWPVDPDLTSEGPALWPVDPDLTKGPKKNLSHTMALL